MDSSIQIKNNLISRIESSNDLSFLQALQTIFDRSEQSLLELSDEQIDSINLSREEIKKGDFKNHNQVIGEMKEWLEKK